MAHGNTISAHVCKMSVGTRRTPIARGEGLSGGVEEWEGDLLGVAPEEG
jgi:hypothetical protein